MSDSDEVPLSMSSLFEGMSIHIAVARPATFEKIVRDHKGTVTSLKKADVVVAAKNCKSFLPKKKYVTRNWLQESVREGEVAPFATHLLNEKDVQKTDKSSSDDEAQTNDDKAAKNTDTKKQTAKAPTRKKRLHLAIDESGDAATLIPIIKQLGGTVHNISNRIQDRADLTALVSAGVCASPESALASLYNIPVVAESWLYAGLEDGTWAELKPHILISADRNNTLPFKGMNIYIHGRPNSSIGIPGIELIISAGGGDVTSRLKNATVVVAFSRFNKDVSCPVVQPEWLFSCAQSLQHLSVEDYYISDDEGSSSDESSDSSSEAPQKAKKAARKKAAKKPSKKASKKQTADSSSDSSEHSARAVKGKKIRKTKSATNPDNDKKKKETTKAEVKTTRKKTVKKPTNESDECEPSPAKQTSDSNEKKTRKKINKPASDSESSAEVVNKKSPTKNKTSDTKKNGREIISKQPDSEASDNDDKPSKKSTKRRSKKGAEPSPKGSKKEAASDSDSETAVKKKKKAPVAEKKSTRKIIRKATSESEGSEEVSKKVKRKEPPSSSAQGKRSKVDPQEEDSAPLPKVVGMQANRFADSSSEEVKSASDGEHELPALEDTPLPPSSSLPVEPPNNQERCVSEDLGESGDAASEFSGISLDDADEVV
eukprot:TRINITY_DN7550_c0_g1_i1.p1 TRINITY_DN7550_c0_g1~~TRINITY_DN7550_c0_g1_i1.p1  ORF type:complete len:657 (+),score=197.95 TRINITY_DN7550_c0_g1_i1:42-2012(+)